VLFVRNMVLVSNAGSTRAVRLFVTDKLSFSEQLTAPPPPHFKLLVPGTSSLFGVCITLGGGGQ
jgi:hypothetical protein